MVDDLKFDELKTRVMVAALANLVGKSSALILMPAKDEAYGNAIRSAGNIPDAKILLASYLNVRDLLRYDKIVLPLKSLDVLSAHLGKE